MAAADDALSAAYDADSKDEALALAAVAVLAVVSAFPPNVDDAAKAAAIAEADAAAAC